MEWDTGERTEELGVTRRSFSVWCLGRGKWAGIGDFKWESQTLTGKPGKCNTSELRGKVFKKRMINSVNFCWEIERSETETCRLDLTTEQVMAEVWVCLSVGSSCSPGRGPRAYRREEVTLILTLQHHPDGLTGLPSCRWRAQWYCYDVQDS